MRKHVVGIPLLKAAHLEKKLEPNILINYHGKSKAHECINQTWFALDISVFHIYVFVYVSMNVHTKTENREKKEECICAKFIYAVAPMILKPIVQTTRPHTSWNIFVYTFWIDFNFSFRYTLFILHCIQSDRCFTTNNDL